MPTDHAMSCTIRLKRALGLPAKKRSRRAIERPIRHIMRLKEKYRRDALKNGTDKKIIRCILKGSLLV
jgi:hypothetical protein